MILVIFASETCRTPTQHRSLRPLIKIILLRMLIEICGSLARWLLNLLGFVVIAASRALMRRAEVHFVLRLLALRRGSRRVHVVAATWEVISNCSSASQFVHEQRAVVAGLFELIRSRLRDECRMLMNAGDDNSCGSSSRNLRLLMCSHVHGRRKSRSINL